MASCPEWGERNGWRAPSAKLFHQTETAPSGALLDERSVRERCLADVAGCELYIGIVGMRYGFIPPGQQRSITEQAAPATTAPAVPAEPQVPAVPK